MNKEDIEEYLENKSPSKWEENFLNDILEKIDKGYTLSEAQEEKVNEVINR